MKTFFRTHNCNELRKENLNQEVVLSGWINKLREHGNLVFIDLKDRYGVTQITVSKEVAKNLKKGFVIKIKGLVEEKPEPNKNLETGEIEVKVSTLDLLSESKSLPIDIDGNSEMTEDTRLKYRYLDLRRKEMQESIILRHKIVKATRDFFDKENFLEIETPVLAKSTPEGARDYLVPSRVNKGKFYALPQSPQIFKQLLMVSGFDRYMQIVKCFRDEDLRKDRQPEFTQVDIEMSFVNQEDVLNVNEKYLTFLFKKVMNIDLQTPFERLTYETAMEKYGSDKPDIRFDLFLNDVTEIAKKSDFNVFKEAECVKCIIVEKDFSRKEIDELTNLVKIYRAKGLAYLKFNNKFDSGISKFVENIELELIEKLNLKNDSTLFFVADNKEIVNDSLGALRSSLGNKLNLVKDEFKFAWITDFPMFEWNEENQRYVSKHHPFTMPKIDKLEDLDQDIIKIPSIAYDITLNGFEIGGGSIRIHNQNIQSKIFELLGISKDEAKQKFGFLLDALSYGAPPHGGIAYGVDRLVMLMANKENIREVIAFPKNKDAEDLMMDAPSLIDDKQLDEIGMKLK
jgi:aspartyl-tRNA synthetase